MTTAPPALPGRTWNKRLKESRELACLLLGMADMRVARRRADWPEMLRRCESLRRNFPNFWPGWIESADALAALGRHVEGAERRREAAERFPNEFWPNYSLALLAAK